MKPFDGAHRLLSALAARRGAWIALTAAALVVRLAVVETAPPRMMWSDGRYYEAIGWQVASEGRYGSETLYPPAYPTLIGAVYAVAGRNLFALRVTEAVLSTAAVVLVGVTGTWLITPAAGLLAALFAAFHPVLVLLPVTHYVENLLVLLSVIAFGAFAWALRRPGIGRWLLAGAAFGLFTLCKPNVVGFLPGLALGALLELQRQHVAPWKFALCFVLGLGIALAPWLVRNRIVNHRWYLVATGGGAAVWRGSGPLATGATDWNPRPTPALEESLSHAADPVERDAIYLRDVRRAVLADPARAARLYLVKIGNLWALWPNTQTATPYRNVRANVAMGLCSAVLYLGALLGLRQMGRWRLGAFALAIVSFTLINGVALMVMRYRMSFEVLLIWLAAAGWLSLAATGAAPAPARPDSAPRPRAA